MSSSLPSHADVVIIGGGVVGCSILFHLAKFGCKDAILLERDELTSGSSWHAAGQIHTISSDPNISRLQSYTINLYDEIEQTSGHSIGAHRTGGFYLASTDVWHDYLKRERSKARSMGLDQEFISLDEVARLHPLIDPKHYVSALWDPLDGDIDPSGVTYAYAKSAKVHGADYRTHTPVLETRQTKDGSWDVVTSSGTIRTEKVVNAAGLWAREVGHMAGLHLPVQPMEHHYLLTEDIPAIVDRKERLPAGIDYESNIYFRQEQNGLLLGTYEPRGTPWQVSGTPTDFGHELLPPDLDRIADRLEMAFERIPALSDAGIKRTINGPFTFGPDGNPMIGPVCGLTNYWSAVGVMAGFCQAGGVGLCLAQWMLYGEPDIDVAAMDIARFGDFATPDWGTLKSSENYERRFVMTFPNETLPKGRCRKVTNVYDRLVSRGAVMGVSFGLEHVLWFADSIDNAYEEPTFRRNRSHDYVAAEVNSVRNNVGAIELANFAKHEISGEGAEAFISNLLAGCVPSVGRLSLNPMLSPKGKLYGDFTLANLGKDRFLLIGSGSAQEIHRRWIESQLPSSGVTYRNLSDDYHGWSISGPNSRKLLERIVRDDVSNESFRFRDIKETFVGGVPAILARVSYSGELGYEIHCPHSFHSALLDSIEEAGKDLGLKLYGSRTLMSLRLEKGWGAWQLDFRPDFTASQSGLDIFIDWTKDFIGKDAALSEKESGPDKKLVTLKVSVDDMDVVGDEAIMKNGECIGYVTSGGYAHHLGCSLAMSYLPISDVESGESVEVELNGEFYSAEIILEPLYDSTGSRMRG